MTHTLLIGVNGGWQQAPFDDEPTLEALLETCHTLAAQGHAVQLEEATPMGSVVVFSHGAGVHAPLESALNEAACFEGA
jgi:hypothetical protein